MNVPEPVTPPLPLVPWPAHVELGDGPPFLLTPQVAVVAGPGCGGAASVLVSALAAFGVHPRVRDGGAAVAVPSERWADAPSSEETGTIRLHLHAEPDGGPASDGGSGRAFGSEVALETDAPSVSGAYRLTVDDRRVLLTAGDVAGLLHGVATLVQAIGGPTSGSAGPAGSVGRAVPAGPAVPDVPRVPALVVADAPRFGWRGLSLDLARRFHGMPTLRAVVDVMASLKLNVLHLHLTDDQGWRLEIPSRPALTERSGSTAVEGGPAGFLTVAEYGELVEHAAARGITVVPELDLPGHVNAALHAYGELTPSGEPAPAYDGIDVGFSRLDADLPATGPFVRDVLGDLLAMTPGPCLHIGGDEAYATDPAEYARLVGAAMEQVRAAGRTVVAWQEAARLRPGPGAVVQYWDERDGADDVVAAAAGGTDVLLSPASRVYLDLKYDADTPLGLEWAGHVELRDAYDWDPLAVLPGVAPERVVGVEAALWSETLRTPDDVFRMLLPRLAAVAEVAWTAQERRGWSSFADRVPGAAAAWERAGLAWHRSPQVRW